MRASRAIPGGTPDSISDTDARAIQQWTRPSKILPRGRQAERFNREPDKVAGFVFVSTVLTLLEMPALVWAALRLSAAH